MKNLSPLRYPGGKTALYPIIRQVIQKENINDCIYIEPFAGGAGVALKLLFDGIVKSIVINDADKAIYSFWRTILESTDWFLQKVLNTPVTIDEWKNQKKIFLSSHKYSREYGFSTFFLNRTNRSGILSAGPIGGYRQEGKYKLDCRYNKEKLVDKIRLIAMQRKNIKIYNKDICNFLSNFLSKYNAQAFIYFDPPYFDKGKRLYMNYFTMDDHELLRDKIERSVTCKWIMTYDNKLEIRKLYAKYNIINFSINYSLSNKGKGEELMISKDISFDDAKILFEKVPKSVFCDMQT